jgi:transcriptional regulator NrdR family protein
MRRIYAAVLVLSVLLVGCTAQFGYRYLDTFIEWQLDDYVELTDDQQERASEIIDELHQWHAMKQIPQYRVRLQSLRQALAEDTVDRDLLEQIEMDAWYFWQQIKDQIAARTDFLNTLSDVQKQQLIASMQSKIDEQREEEAEEGDDLFASYDRVKRRQESIEERLGTLTDAQRQLIKVWVTESEAVPNDYDWLAYRQRWLDAFEKALLQSPIKAERIESLITDPEQMLSDEQRENRRAKAAIRHQYLAKLSGTLNQEQRDTLVEQLDEYIETCRDIEAHFGG